VRSDYWNVTDEQVLEKTRRSLQHWSNVLAKLDTAAMRSNDIVAHLQKAHGVPRYWARTLTTWYLKKTQPPTAPRKAK
jgi:hypothetical protein